MAIPAAELKIHQDAEKAYKRDEAKLQSLAAGSVLQKRKFLPRGQKNLNVIYSQSIYRIWKCNNW